MEPEATLGAYRIVSPLGAGGMGEVYRAHDPKLGRDVAIKVLPEEMSADPERIARFQREARALATLQHPNIASVYGFEEDDDHRFLVMELVEGQDLSELLKAGPIPVDQVVALALQLTDGLAAAHEQGIIPRDVLTEYPHTVTTRFLPAPKLPSWLERELPFNRRVFADDGHTIHFIDEGEGPVVLLLHGNPTWCYLWRKVIRILAQEDIRIIAPDLVGLGLSDKPRDAAIHTLDFHAERISALVKALDLHDLTLAAQDWGGPIGAVMAARNPDRIRGAVFGNTSIRVPSHPPRVTPFHRFSRTPVISDLAFRHLNLLVRNLHRAQGDRASIGATERRAYLYPFPKIADRTAPLALARLVPTDLASPTFQTMQEADDWARSCKGPVKLVWGRRDPILGRTIHSMKKLFPDAEVTETGAGHFLQEEVPEELADAILKTVRDAGRIS